MRRLSVRGQLALWFAACLAAGLVAFGVGLYLLFGRYLLGEVDRGLEEEIIEVVREVRHARPDELRAELVENFGGHGFYVIRVTDPAGKLVFVTPTDAPDLPSSPSSQPNGPRMIDVAGRSPYRMIVSVVDRPDGRYDVAVGDSLALYHSVLRQLVVALAVLGPAAAAVSLFGGYWLARRALAPVDRLTRAALTISATDLHRRVPQDGTKDEVGRLAAAFNSMLGRLEAAFEETRRFTADAAHELRTPLAVLRTATEVALRADGTAEDFRRVMDGQLKEIGRLSRLADQLLFLCREDAGLRDERPNEVRLDLLLEDLCETLQLTAEAKSLAINCEEVSPCTITAPPDRVRRLFLNLVDNSLRYTPPGGRVDVRLTLSNAEAVVTVADDGVGIAVEHVPRVFERFYRGDESRSRETGGAGLGLAICRSVTDSLGGRISITSEVDRGTVMEVRLPCLVARDVSPGSGGRHE